MNHFLEFYWLNKKWNRVKNTRLRGDEWWEASRSMKINQRLPRDSRMSARGRAAQGKRIKTERRTLLCLSLSHSVSREDRSARSLARVLSIFDILRPHKSARGWGKGKARWIGRATIIVSALRHLRLFYIYILYRVWLFVAGFRPTTGKYEIHRQRARWKNALDTRERGRERESERERKKEEG